jgi:hypothetical protein
LKTWVKIISVVLIVFIFCSIFAFINKEEKACVLCEAFRYHAPCLLDLEEGKLIELEIYFPHETFVAELADPQPERGIMSLYSIGEASGYFDSYTERVEMTIPQEKTYNPALCKECRRLLNTNDRYVVGDLYQDKNLIPIIENMEIELRCYSILASQEEKGIKLIVQGNLE